MDNLSRGLALGVQELGTGTKAYKLDKLASNNVFHEVDSVNIWVLDLTEDKHL